MTTSVEPLKSPEPLETLEPLAAAPPPADARANESFFNTLNPEQYKAVHMEGMRGVLVLAGAGTGKTRVLTGRVIHLIASKQARPAQILAVTFTNKAAREMKSRIRNNLTGDLMHLFMGTFHSICHRILRTHAVAAGWNKNFNILDKYDQITFIRRLLRTHEIDDRAFKPAAVAHYINRAKEKARRAAAMPALAQKHHERELAAIYALYESATRREHKMDFAELMLSTLDLLRSHDEVRRHYAERFRHILVDELQDTNTLQFALLKLLDSGSNCYFGVGDDDQSIYAFRGAEPGVMRRFQGELRASELVRLEQNYRSVGNILHAANALIAGNRQRIGKRLTTTASNGASIYVCAAANALDEADSVATRISEQLEANPNSRPRDHCILYRTNAQSRVLEQACIKYGIPHRIYSGLRFFDREEIKHALAFLRLLVQDDIDSLLRIINVPPRGIGKKTVDELRAHANVFAYLAGTDNPRLRVFAALLAELKAMASSLANGEMGFSTLIKNIVEKSGLMEHYRNKQGEEERAENLSDLINAASEFSDAHPDLPADEIITSFLSLVALESAADADSEQSAVSLMTVHAAKGLEFNHVHIVGLEEELFPHQPSFREPDAKDNTEEERRLLYVAVTRARQTLSLYFANMRMIYGTTHLRSPSRFLQELPQSILGGDAEDLPPPLPPSTYDTPPNQTESNSSPAEADASPPPSAPPKDNGHTLKPGTQVEHARYGRGIVIRVSGHGKNATADITFKTVGVRAFKTARAKLKILSRK